MANGSFGLSGLPTAPSTVGTVPNNALSPVTVAVNSLAGFQAGDLIYNVNGDVQPIPGNYVSTATFPITDNAPSFASGASTGECQDPPVTLGCTYKSNNTAAKLTNGNIVLVYQGGLNNNNQYVYFKIVDENNTVVVTDTLTNSSFPTQAGAVTVGALTGGGFAIAWYDANNGWVAYAIYDNAGTTVKAPATDSGVTISAASSYLGIYPRPDGSFILSGVTSGTLLQHKIFSATGIQIYNWTNVVSNQSTAYKYEYVVRSDNSFVIVYTNASTQPSFKVYSATNTNTATTVLSTTTFANANNWGGASLLTNGNIIVTWGTGAGIAYAQITPANAITGNTTYSFWSTNTSCARPIALSDGNYAVVFYHEQQSSGGITDSILGYAFFNTSNTLLSSSSGNFIFSGAIGTQYQPTLIQTTNSLNVFWTPNPRGNQPANTYPNIILIINWVKINTTTYATIPVNSTTVSVGNSSAQVVSGYARSTSTPISAAFFPATSGTVSATVARSTNAASLIAQQTTLNTDANRLGIDATTLPNGNALILDVSSGSGATYVRLYEISRTTYAVVNTVTLATDANNDGNTQTGLAKVTVLTDGKIVVSYVTTAATSTITMLILSSAYSILTTVTQSANCTTNAGCGIAALSNARFVLAYFSSTTPSYAIWNSSGTSIVSGTTVSASTGNSIAVGGYKKGFVVTWCHGTSYTNKAYWEPTTNSFTTGSQYSVSSPGANRIFARKMLTGPQQMMYDFFPTNTTTQLGVVNYPPMCEGNSYSSIAQNNIANAVSINTTSGVCAAVTGYGEFVTFSWYSATQLGFYYNTSSLGNGTLQTAPFNISGLSLPANVGSCRWAGTGLTGHSVLVVLLNSSGHLTYLVFNPNSYVYASSLVAGTTPSNTTALSAEKGVALVGVSTTAASANGTGTVQINGSAQLNSNYSATTAGQSFNFNNPVTFGAAGSINGRNVTLIGNV